MPMSLAQKAVYKIIDEILWNEWDPLGVNDMEEARDEYQSYTPQVFSLKLNNRDKETIAQHLLKIEKERMDLPGNIEKCRKVAEKIVTSSLP